MELLVFGSTGGTGRQLVEQALERGHTVTAFARDPAKLDIEHANLKVVRGDVLDLASVERAVGGQDAVLSSIGAGRKGRIRSEGTRNIIRAMENAGVRRLICQSTLGVGDSRRNLTFFWKYIMFGTILRDVLADHESQENYVKRSRLDWTIVRAAALRDGDRTGIYQHGFSTSHREIKHEISRADVADFMLNQLTNDTYLHTAVGVSY